MNPSQTFDALSLSPAMQRVIAEMGYTKMTPIQAASIPLLLNGQDLVGQSQTGSGKTAAFVIPILEKINVQDARPQALVLCPTRELCDQVLRECRKFSKAFSGLQVVALVGGQPFQPQAQALTKGVHLIVGTPGRTLEHFQLGNIPITNLGTLVLDEADRMLEEGFAEELSAILQELPTKRQMIFFSATFPVSMEALVARHLKHAARVRIEASDTPAALAIEQFLYRCENPEKIKTLTSILRRHPSPCTLVFCRTKATVAAIGRHLSDLKISCDVLHGDLEQSERDRATLMFRNGSTRVLVATDVAARGLDIEALELVINVDLPSSPEIYIHRIGRTGRAGRTGTAVSIATDYETEKVAEIEAATGVVMQRLKPESQGGRLSPELQQPRMHTLQLFGGKSDRLRPGDILGALTAEPNALPGKAVGKIEVLERFTYVAVETSQSDKALNKLRSSKIKGSKFKAFRADLK